MGKTMETHSSVKSIQRGYCRDAFLQYLFASTVYTSGAVGLEGFSLGAYSRVRLQDGLTFHGIWHVV